MNLSANELMRKILYENNKYFIANFEIILSIIIIKNIGKDKWNKNLSLK